MDGVVHFELPMDDAERAKKFYSETFGWGITAMPEMQYTMVKTEADVAQRGPKSAPMIGGGLVNRGAIITTPSFAIMVMDIDAAIEKVKAGGGTIIKEKTSMGGADGPWMAYFKDTEGNVLSLWQPTAAEIAASKA